MVVCNVPAQTRRGFAYFDYLTNGNLVPHRCRLGLRYPVQPTDTSIILPEIELITDLVQDILPTNSSIVDQGTMDANGSVVIVLGISATKPGLHGTALGAEDYLSRTITFTGKGVPGTIDDCTGQTRMVLYVGQAFNFLPGQKYLAAGPYPPLDALVTELMAQTVLGADFYGQEVNWRNKYPIQFNAYTQRRLGQ